VGASAAPAATSAEMRGWETLPNMADVVADPPLDRSCVGEAEIELLVVTDEESARKRLWRL